jgi:hypothetical protein
MSGTRGRTVRISVSLLGIALFVLTAQVVSNAAWAGDSPGWFKLLDVLVGAVVGATALVWNTWGWDS